MQEHEVQQTALGRLDEVTEVGDKSPGERWGCRGVAGSWAWRASSALRSFHGIGDGKELGQREFKAWQQRSRIRFLLGNDDLCDRLRATPHHGHTPPKAVDDPVFQHTGAQVFVTL